MKRTVDAFDEIDADSNGDMDSDFSKDQFIGKPINEVDILTSKEYFAKRYAALLDTVGKIIRSPDGEFTDFAY